MLLKKLVNLIQNLVYTLINSENKYNNQLKNKLDSDTMYLGRNKADNRDLDNFYTVHASKGLEASRVVILNNFDDILGFPNQIINDRISKYLINFKELNNSSLVSFSNLNL